MILNAMGKVYRLFVLFLSCFLFLAVGAAQEKILEGGRTFYLHKVQKGEGFYRLSVMYHVAQKEIIDANPDLAFKGLKEGDLVKVPAKSSSEVQATQSQNGFIRHTVKKGQTLYAISREYGVPVDKIIALNPGVEHALAEGSVIKLPAKIMQKDAPINDNNGHQEGYVIHTVAPGETLFRIAQQYQISLGDLQAANPVVNGSPLAVGERVRIPRKVEGALNGQMDSLFLLHKVAAGETLFGISQKYGRSQAEIKLVNEDLASNGIHEGQVLRIPREPLDLLLEKRALFITHSLKRKETLYGLGRQYDADIDVIKMVNPDVDFASLKKGMEIRVPRPAWYQKVVSIKVAEVVAPAVEKPVSLPVAETPCSGYDYSISRPAINVAMMLPFDYAGHQMVKQTPDSLIADVHRSIVARSTVFLEFYEGALLAIDSLKRQGASVNLYVYDTYRDSSNFSKVLQRPELASMNLIIGPTQIDHMKSVATFAKEKQIPVVFPFSVMDGSIRSNPYVYQASPIDSLYRRAAVEAQLNVATNKRVVVLTTGGNHPFELAVINQIKQHIQQNGTGQQNIAFHQYIQREVASLDQLMDPDHNSCCGAKH